MHAALGGEGGYHLRLAGGSVPSRSYLLELIVTLKPDGKRETMNTCLGIDIINEYSVIIGSASTPSTSTPSLPASASTPLTRFQVCV